MNKDEAKSDTIKQLTPSVSFHLSQTEKESQEIHMNSAQRILLKRQLKRQKTSAITSTLPEDQFFTLLKHLFFNNYQKRK